MKTKKLPRTEDDDLLQGRLEEKDCVYIETRDYVVNNTIEIPNNTIVDFQNSIINSAAGVAMLVMDGALVKNLRLLPITKWYRVGVGIWPDKVDGILPSFRLDNVEVSQFGTGIELFQCVNCNFTRMMVSDCATGIHIMQKYVNALRYEGQIRSNAVGISIDGAQHFGMWFKATIEGNASCGVRIVGQCSNVNFTQCYFEQNSGGSIVNQAANPVYVSQSSVVRSRATLLEFKGNVIVDDQTQKSM